MRHRPNVIPLLGRDADALGTTAKPTSRDRQLGHFATPRYAAELLIERYLPNLCADDFVIEPTCGEGHILAAIPASVPCLGVELDSELAERARRLTGRTVIQGDFAQVALPADTIGNVSVIVGNPPFAVDTIDAILARSRRLLRARGTVVFILGAHYFATSARIARLSQSWSMRQEMIPRDLFGRISVPLCVAIFQKSAERTMVGFAFYHEVSSIRDVDARFREILEQAGGSIWKAAVAKALVLLGGEASLEQIYGVMERRRPSPNAFWREKIRQVVQTGMCERTARGRYRLAEAV